MDRHIVITTLPGGVWTHAADGWTYSGPVDLRVFDPSHESQAAVRQGPYSSCVLLNQTGSGPTSGGARVRFGSSSSSSSSSPSSSDYSDMSIYTVGTPPVAPPVAECSRRRSRADFEGTPAVRSFDEQRWVYQCRMERDRLRARIEAMDAALAPFMELPQADDDGEPSCEEIPPPPRSPIPIIELSSDSSEEDPEEDPDEESEEDPEEDPEEDLDENPDADLADWRDDGLESGGDGDGDP